MVGSVTRLSSPPDTSPPETAACNTKKCLKDVQVAPTAIPTNQPLNSSIKCSEQIYLERQYTSLSSWTEYLPQLWPSTKEDRNEELES